MFTINIETTNDAFGAGVSDPDAAAEVARILHQVAGELRNGRVSGRARDFNGDTVGEWRLADD